MRTTLLLAIQFLFISLITAQPKEEQGSLTNEIVYEKLYLHIDREVYAPRETIWFKAYLLSGISNRPIKGAKNVYVHLVNDSGKVVHERLLLSFDGGAIGDFEIPFDTPEGTYTIRAFTKYLQNFGEESYFHKKIWIAKMKRKENEGGNVGIGEFDLSFFPESGSLIYNASNTVAFKAIDTLGHGISIVGTIIDDLGNEISPFNTEFMGMGSFVIMPQKGRRYYAKVEGCDKYHYEFLDIQDNGIALNVIPESSDIRFILSRDLTRSGKQTLQLRASSKGVSLFSEQLTMQSFTHQLSVHKSRFPLGISKITLEDEQGRILAERIIFVDAGFPDLIEIQTDREVYEPRDSVGVTISSLIENYDSISTGLSVAVINRNYLNRNGYSKDIRSYLLLDSELKGPVESPASYFSSGGRLSSSEKLNLLMMVQGWRSYYWPEIILKIPDDLVGWEDIGLSVSGTVKRLFRDQLIPGASLRIGPFSSAFSFRDTIANSNARFRFDYLYLRDSSNLVVQGKNERGRPNVEIFLDPMYVPDTLADIRLINRIEGDLEVPRSFYGESYSKLEAERKYAIESGTYWLEEVEIVKEMPVSFSNFMKPEVDRMYGTPDKSIKITDEDMVYFSVFDYLESNPIAGVIISGGDQISIRGGEEPLYMVDGMEVDHTTFISTPMGDIETIDIIMNAAGMAGMGSKGAHGVVSVYTRIGEYSTFQRYVKGRAIKKVNGFHWPKEFYSPRYTLKNIEHPQPDYRPTLYWNPRLEMDTNQAHIDFFTSDFISDYIIIVEGISGEGEILTGMTQFSVRK